MNMFKHFLQPVVYLQNAKGIQEAKIGTCNTFRPDEIRSNIKTIVPYENRLILNAVKHNPILWWDRVSFEIL